MIQLEFEEIRWMFGATWERRRRKPSRQAPSAIDYTLRLSAALRVYNLTHPLHDVLCAVAKLELARGHATIPAVSFELCCSYQNVVLHFLRNGELFEEETGHKPRRYRLSPEALRLMGKIKTRISRHE